MRATHTFLADEDILRIREYVPQALVGATHLILAEEDTGRPVACMGIQEGCLEMLLLGRRLLEYGITHYAVTRLAVNEQNPQARGFYEHMGFRVDKRTDFDERGNAYPLCT